MKAARGWAGILIVLISAWSCTPGREAPVQTGISLVARDETVEAGASTRISLFYNHPSPALPVLSWESDSGSIIRSIVANEVIFQAPRSPGIVTIKAKAVSDQASLEASLSIRVVPATPSRESAAQASARSPGIVDKLLFADSGPLYVQPREPSAVDPVILKFRTRAGFGSRVLLRYSRDGAEAEREMVRLSADPAFEYHVAEVPAGVAPLEYWFEVRSGSTTLYYSRMGVESSPPAPAWRFRLVPGRRVPAWTRGACLYWLETDRFFDGDPADNPKSGPAWGALPAADATVYGGDLEGLARKADYLRGLGLDALLISPFPALTDAGIPAFKGVLDRLAARGLRSVFTAPADWLAENIPASAQALGSAAAGADGFMVGAARGADFIKRLRESVKASSPESAILIDTSGSEDLDLGLGDLILNAELFTEPASALLLGKDLSGTERPAALADASAFARAFAFRAAGLPQHMSDNALLALDLPGRERFISRALSESGESKAGTGTDSGGPAQRAAPSSAPGSSAASASYRLGLLLQMSLPGAPLIRYGAEAGLAGGAGADAQRPFPWGAEDRDLLAAQRSLAAVRKAHPALRGGSYALVASDEDGLLAFSRWNDKENILVVLNVSKHQAAVRLPMGQLGLAEGGKLKTVFSTDQGGHSTSGPSYVIRSGSLPLNLGPRSGLILAGPGSREAAPAAPARPRVLRTFPADKAKEIAQDTRIIIQFSAPMDQDAAASAIGLDPKAPGSFVWNGNTCAFVPEKPLLPKTTYTVSVARAMSAREGGFSMGSSMSFSFTTR